jgi:hypothetical protein
MHPTVKETAPAGMSTLHHTVWCKAPSGPSGSFSSTVARRLSTDVTKEEPKGNNALDAVRSMELRKLSLAGWAAVQRRRPSSMDTANNAVAGVRGLRALDVVRLIVLEGGVGYPKTERHSTRPTSHGHVAMAQATATMTQAINIAPE